MQEYFSKGRPTSAARSTVAVMKYLPRVRSPVQPSTFRRENLQPDDLDKVWAAGRSRTNRTPWGKHPPEKILDENVTAISQHEMEKFMPNIDIGAKAQVTPVSLMSARFGHRVTAPLVHSYDPYIGKKDGNDVPVIDHDAIQPTDPHHWGLHTDTVGSRSRLYRYLRRGPFFQEKWYYARTMLRRPGAVSEQYTKAVESEEEKGTVAKLLRLAAKGHVKAACEEYRKLTYIPPVEAYRALIKACVPDALLGDAVAIFEDGAKLLFTARDAEVYRHLMDVAIRAKHPARVMWAYNLSVGTSVEKHFAKLRTEPLHQYELLAKALGFFLDEGYAEHARELYGRMRDEGMLEFDACIRLGHDLRAKLKKGEKASLPTAAAVAGAPGAPLVVSLAAVSTVKAADDAMTDVANAFVARAPAHLAALWTRELPPGTAAPADAAPETKRRWLLRAHSDVDAHFVLRHARFTTATVAAAGSTGGGGGGGGVDLLATDLPRFVDRALRWLTSLSAQAGDGHGAPLPYLVRSRPSTTNPAKVRVAFLPNGAVPPPPSSTANGADAAISPRAKHNRLLPCEQGATFHYTADTRFVQETFPPVLLETGRVPVQPVHIEVAGSVRHFDEPLPSGARATALVHASVRKGGAAAAAAAASLASTADGGRAAAVAAAGAAVSAATAALGGGGSGAAGGEHGNAASQLKAKPAASASRSPELGKDF